MARIPRPPIDDAAFNLKCRQWLEDWIDDWEDRLEEGARCDHTGEPSDYDTAEVAREMLEYLEQAAKLLGRQAWAGLREAATQSAGANSTAARCADMSGPTIIAAKLTTTARSAAIGT